jgi:hypothetical protein
LISLSKPFKIYAKKIKLKRRNLTKHVESSRYGAIICRR